MTHDSLGIRSSSSLLIKTFGHVSLNMEFIHLLLWRVVEGIRLRSTGICNN